MSKPDHRIVLADRQCERTRYGDIHVLVVEASLYDTRFIREMLLETDYASAQLHSFRTLRDAIAAPLVHNSVAAILLDLDLPDSEGLATLLQIRNTYPDSAIIVLTGPEGKGMAIQALRIGAQNYLTKMEVDPSVLGRTLRNAIERHGFLKRLRASDRLNAERDLRFRMLVHHSADLTLVMDRAGCVSYASPAVRRAFGYRKDQRMSIFGLIHPEDIDRTRADFKRILSRPGMPVTMVLRVRACDDRYLHLEGTVNALVDVPGVMGVVANFRDVTDRIVLEQRIASDRSNLNALINSTKDQVWSLDRNNCLITGNKAFLDAVEHFSGRRLKPGDSMVFPDMDGVPSADKWLAYFQRALSGKYVRLDERITYPVEAWMEIHYSPIEEDGEIIGVAGSIRDITERVTLEKQVTFDRNNLAALINATPDLMWGIDRDMVVTTANAPFLGMVKAMFGVDLVIGMHALDTVDHDPVQYARWEGHYRRALAGERFSVYEEQPEPMVYRACITLNPIMDGDAVVGVACFSQDVTAQTIAERELRRNEAHLLASQRIAQVGSWELDLANADDVNANTLRWSDQAYRIFGVEPGTVPVTNDLFFSLLQPDDRSRVQEAFACALHTGTTYSLDHRIVLPTGEERVVHEHSDMVRDPATGRVLKMIGTVHDITERKRAEAEIRELNADLEQRVTDRTSELLLANERLETEAYAKEKLANELRSQKEEQTASLRYARGIQEALLPNATAFTFFRDHAIMNRPLDLVGGDMYWAHATERLQYVAVGDCTGHGVPGAMLTMIGHDILNTLVLEEEQVRPDMMLARIDRRFEQLFHTCDGAASMKDGMDMALCIIDRATLELTFAGATLSALVLRDGVIKGLAGAKVNLGGLNVPGRKQFTVSTMQLLKGDRLILGTDGFADQFGGPHDRKLMRAGYHEQLLSCAHLNASDAVAYLRQRFNAWMGDNDQVDDVLLMVLDV